MAAAGQMHSDAFRCIQMPVLVDDSATSIVVFLHFVTLIRLTSKMSEQCESWTNTFDPMQNSWENPAFSGNVVQIC